VIAVGSHDTASAVAGVPAHGENFAYISSGTWSLVGVELGQPVLTEASRRANFTNETGLDHTVRYLRNVAGLWLLQESTRTWQSAGLDIGQDELAAPGRGRAPLRSLIDPDDPRSWRPGDMPTRIAAACRATVRPCRTGRPRPRGASWTASRSPTGARSSR